MDTTEAFLDEVSKEVPVVELSLIERGYEGLYRNGRIYVEKSLPTIRKKERVAEEYTHHLLSVGEIINYNTFESRKQEVQARNAALELLVPLDKLIECSFAGCATKFECADYLEVEIDTLSEAIQHYSDKFGTTYFYKGCILRFNGDSVFVLNTGLKF